MRTAEQFWAAVDKSAGPDGCWPWLKSADENGYGWVNWQGKSNTSNRVAFFLHSGVWPDHACHTCDNPPCCNPTHLFNGTRLDNLADMNRKGRHFRPVGYLPHLRRANEARRKPDALKPCACGCGGQTVKKFIHGHNRVAFTTEVRAKMSVAKRKART